MLDLFKSICSLICTGTAVVVFFWGLFSGNFLGGCILAGLAMVMSIAFINGQSEETKEGARRLEEQKRYERMNCGYKCPSCGAMAGHELGAIEKGVSVGALGLASNKIGKRYKCAKCGYIW